MEEISRAMVSRAHAPYLLARLSFCVVPCRSRYFTTDKVLEEHVKSKVHKKRSVKSGWTRHVV